jgi:hypothetical protein
MNAAASNEPRAWTSRHWGSMAALVFLAQCALIFVFGARKPNPVLAVTQAPSLQLASADDEFIALNDPTLFALPHANDFGAAKRMQIPAIQQPSFDWSESPRWLPLAGTDLLHSFARFMQTNPFSTGSLDFKPEPIFSEPALPSAVRPQWHSTLNLRGELARRALLRPIDLTNWTEVDVIAPSKVQVLVNVAGQVISAVLLPPDSGIVPADPEFDAETRDGKADQRALQLARRAKFAPASEVTLGQMIFNWHVVPMTVANTNIPSKLP